MPDSVYQLSEEDADAVLEDFPEVTGQEVSDIAGDSGEIDDSDGFTISGDQVVTDERVAAVASYPVNSLETRRRRADAKAEPRLPPVIGEIEDGIPLPPAPPAGTYNWSAMKIGQSFFVTGTTLAGINRSARIWAEKNNRKAVFEGRAVGDGFRVWRNA